MKISFVIFWIGLYSSCFAIEQFEESFDGTGTHEPIGGGIVGFDNPNWDYFGTGEFANGGLKFDKLGANVIGSFDFDSLERKVVGNGSFVEQIVIRDVALTTTDSGLDDAAIGLRHEFDRQSLEEADIVSLLVFNSFLLDGTHDWNLMVTIGEEGRRDFRISPGPDLSLTLEFDEPTHDVRVLIDNNLNDAIPASSFGPFPFRGNSSNRQHIVLSASSAFGGRTIGTLDFMSRTISGVFGDFDGNGQLDITDFDALTFASILGSNDTDFDLNSDNLVDGFDRNVWVKDLANTWFGDSNLNGEFNSSDLVNVFSAAEYEDDIDSNSTWSTGDWNGDGDFNSRDLVIAFSDGGYEAGARQSIVVPEPELLEFWLITVFTALASRRLLWMPIQKS